MPGNYEDNKSCLIKFNQDNTITKINIDTVFPIIHGANGEDGSIQGLCALLGIPCCGADIYGSIYCYDKLTTKTIAEKASVKCAGYVSIHASIGFKDGWGDRLFEGVEERFGYPVFVKPSRGGSSVGISKAKNRDELIAAINKAFQYDSIVLVEEAIEGKEVEIAVMGTAWNNLRISACGEIEPGAEFYDYETKYINDTAQYFIPARISDESAEQIRWLAEKIYMNTQCSGFARIDFFVKDNGEVIFNEINTIPGFTPISMFSRMFEHSGIPYSECIDIIIKNAL